MNERLPSVCLVMFCVVGLFVTYQLDVFITALPPASVSHTVSSPRCPPLGASRRGRQPDPLWKMSKGWTNDRVSLPQPPVTLVRAPQAGRYAAFMPPLLFPTK